MFSLERRDLLPLIALTALRPNSRELHQGRVRAAILLVAGVILIILGFMSLPLKYPLIPMNNVALSLTLIIGGFFVMALAAYVDRAESRWYYLPLQSILFVAGVGLMLASLMLFPFILIHSTSPPTMEEQTLIVELSLILFIAGIFVMLLGFYVDRARSRRGHYIRPESPSKK
jgi:drug/metabolite transporter (DMT)-like permease